MIKKSKAELAAYSKRRYKTNPAVRKYAREWARKYLSDPEVRRHKNEVSRAYNQKIKLDAVGHYGGRCACCNESHIEFLAIDHIDGGGNAHRKSIKKSGGKSFYMWLRRQGYPAGFRVLCHNCNFSYGLFGKCPHKDEIT